MIIAQITDLHVVERGQKLMGILDSNAMALDAVRHINAQAPKPDIVLVTGDLTHNGQDLEYIVIREALDSLEIPFYVIPGNHDRRIPLLKAFKDHIRTDMPGFIQYAIEDYPVRLIALDTVIEGHEDGMLCRNRLDWLDDTLERGSDRPTLIFMHHPPFDTGICWMDALELAGADNLRRIISRHQQVGLIACGHIHRSIQTNWGGTQITVAPGTAYQVHLDLAPEMPPHFILEPPACQIHVFNGQEFITHTSYVNWSEKPIDVSPFMGELWETIKSKMRKS